MKSVNIAFALILCGVVWAAPLPQKRTKKKPITTTETFPDAPAVPLEEGVQKATEALNNYDLNNAIQFARGASKSDPNAWQPYRLMAKAYLGLGKPALARKALDLAIANADTESAERLKSGYGDIEQLSAAEAIAAKALAASTAGNHLLAARSYREAFNSFPLCVRYLQSAAEESSLAGDDAGAQADFSMLAQLMPRTEQGRAAQANIERIRARLTASKIEGSPVNSRLKAITNSTPSRSDWQLQGAGPFSYGDVKQFMSPLGAMLFATDFNQSPDDFPKYSYPADRAGVQNGQFFYRGPDVDGAYGTIQIPDVIVKDVAVHAKFKHLTNVSPNAQSFCIALRQQNIGANWQNTFLIAGELKEGHTYGDLNVYGMKDSQWNQAFVAQVTDAWSKDQSIDLYVTLRGDNLRVWMDGTLIVDVHDQTVTGAGHVAIGVGSGSKISFDDVVVVGLPPSN